MPSQATLYTAANRVATITLNRPEKLNAWTAAMEDEVRAAVAKPVIAAINGPVVGLGLVITLYCDLRLASDAARFSTAFARRGLVAEYGMAWMLPKVVGIPNALDLLYSARMIDAQEAMRMGLV